MRSNAFTHLNILNSIILFGIFGCTIFCSKQQQHHHQRRTVLFLCVRTYIQNNHRAEFRMQQKRKYLLRFLVKFIFSLFLASHFAHKQDGDILLANSISGIVHLIWYTPFGQMTCIFSTNYACKRNAPIFFSSLRNWKKTYKRKCSGFRFKFYQIRKTRTHSLYNGKLLHKNRILNMYLKWWWNWCEIVSNVMAFQN